MPQPVAVIFVHGIFAHDLNFALPMQDGLRKLLPRGFHQYINFRSVFWAGTVRNHQLNFMARAQAAADIVDNKLRRLLIQGLGDAAAYQKTWRRANSIYYQVQDKITDEIKALDVRGQGSRPLIFIGHSLGCHVISSYLWDFNKFKQQTEAEIATEPDPDVRSQWQELQRATPFRRLDTFAGFVTLGNNMPLFTFTFGPERVIPITVAPTDNSGRQLHPAFPGAALPEPLRKQARWLNFFSKRDVFGFPLKPLNDDYANSNLIEDITVRSESPISRSLPYWSCVSAHLGYWTNPTVLSRTAKLIRDIAETPLN